MTDLKVIKRENHGYGQSPYTLNRPITLQDMLPISKLDPTKSYRIENGVVVEIKEPDNV